ncbi:MAG: CRTAC1 family protein [Planctomycetaceae bacterium]|nr:CRTAC1 family protein [Planctomycetaceae bacterium]
MRPPWLNVALGVSLLLLTGCPQTPPSPPPGTSTSPSSDAVPKVRTADECRTLLALKNQIIGELENNKLADADRHLQELLQMEPNDPLGHRNLAIARLLAVASNGVTSEQAQQAADQLLAHDSSPTAHWLAGRMSVALAEKLTIPAERDAALGRAVALLEKAADGNKVDPGIPYNIFEVTRYASDAALQEKSKTALVAAAERAPDNLFVLTELLLQQAESNAEDFIATLEHLRQLLGPLRDGILRRTRINVDNLVAAARAGVNAGDWRTALSKCRQLSSVIRPEDRTQSDLRQLTPHPLEFVLPDFASGVCPESPTPPPSIAPQFAATILPADRAEVGLLHDAVAVDFDLDGRMEILVLGERSLQLLAADAEGNFSVKMLELPLPGGLTRLIAADFDRDTAKSKGEPAAGVCFDADPDVVLCGSDGVTVYRNDQADDGSRSLVVVEQTGGLNQVLGARAAIPGDFDHDGDLDLALATDSGVQIWAQTGLMDFANTTERTQFTDGNILAAELIAVDWDRDVDLDIIAVGAAQGGYLENLRHGEFRWREFDPEFGITSMPAAAVIEADGNISWDLAFSSLSNLSTALTTTPDRGRNQFLKQIEIQSEPTESLVSGDWNNDGWVDLAGVTEHGVSWWSGGDGGRFTAAGQWAFSDDSVETLRAADVDQDGDLDLIAVTLKSAVLLRNETTASGNWLAVRVRGDYEPQSGKHNQYGIGSLLEVRRGDHYQARVINGQVTHFGMGTDPAPADSLRILWTSGVPQVVLQPKQNQVICERQALKGSCPYVYTWDGERFTFFTDLLWAAPLGLQFAEGVLAPDRPWEYLLIPGAALVERDGRYDLRVTEELWEAAYFDQIELLAVDHPADVEVFSNEKVGPPDIAKFQIHTVRERRIPAAARDQRGRDVLDQIASADGVFLKAYDEQHRQGLTEPHFLELDLGTLERPEQITLFLTGWIYPTDTSLNVALSQDPHLDGPKPPSLAVPDADGNWQVVRPFLGFPGGKTKTIAVDLSGVFLTDDYRLRIETTHEIRWDAAFFTVNESPAETRVTPLPLLSADLHYRGFSQPRPPVMNAPETYDYEDVSRAPKWPTMGGRYTRFGDVSELLTTTDDRLVVMGSGDEISLSFAVAAEPLPVGWKRDFFLHNVGWDKDADLHTVYGQTTEPLPFQQMTSYPYSPDVEPPQTPAYRDYLRVYQTRQDPAARFWKWSGLP